MNLEFFHRTTTGNLDNIKETKKDLTAMQNDMVKRSLRIIKLFKQKIRKQVSRSFEELSDNFLTIESNKIPEKIQRKIWRNL